MHIATLALCNHLPLADHSKGDTITVIGLLGDPSVILTITSIYPDDSEPINCLDANSTTSNAN